MTRRTGVTRVERRLNLADLPVLMIGDTVILFLGLASLAVGAALVAVWFPLGGTALRAGAWLLGFGVITGTWSAARLARNVAWALMVAAGVAKRTPDLQGIDAEDAE